MQKSYLLWPYLKELETEVTRSFKEEDAFFVELERSLFYPHLAGGQPEDRGSIDGIRVLHVREKDGIIQHQVEEEMPLGPATLILDWERRYDHMQQHTAQHLLSGLFQQMFSVNTVGFMIGEKYTTVDFDALGRHNAEELVHTVCQLANRLIQSALPIHRSFETDAGRLQTKGRGAPIRLIHIPTLSVNECGGTHVGNTSEVGFIRIVKTQRDRGHLRVTYLAGGRCLREYQDLVGHGAHWAERYNTSLTESFARMDRQLQEMDALQEEVREYRKLATEALREQLQSEIRSYRGYKVLWRYVPTGIKPSDLVPAVDCDILFLLNREGAVYGQTKKPMQGMLRFMESLKKDEVFKGGGSSTQWHGQITEGPYAQQPLQLWRKFETFWK